MKTRSPEALCSALTRGGKPCAAFRVAGTPTCTLHTAAGVEAITRARVQAIETVQQSKAAEEADRAAQVQLTTPEEVRAFIQETATRLRAGQIPAATAVALDRLARTSLAAIDSALLADAQREIDASKATRPAVARRRR